MYGIFFDTETNGLPKSWKAPMNDTDNWPRVIQLAWDVADLETGEVVKSRTVLIKPNGWEIPNEKFWIDNGYNTAKSLAEGEPLEIVLTEFITDYNECEIMAAHNMAFDHNIVGAEMIRHGMRAARRIQKVCTMEASVQLCGIPFGRQSKYGKGKQYKWPKLEELHQYLFKSGFEGAHDAGNDVAALRVCFFELVKRGIIKIEVAI